MTKITVEITDIGWRNWLVLLTSPVGIGFVIVSVITALWEEYI